MTAPGVPVPELVWEDCGTGECARFPAPLDYEDPDGATIELFARRLPATGNRIGALFFNFGGPGADASAVSSVPVPGEIRERFDLIGLDPRGVGGSTGLGCGFDPLTVYGVDHTIEDESDVDRLLEITDEYVADCAAERGDLLPHVGTWDVARDMDLLRAAMGDDQLNYVGYSYGSSIGQVYAELFPDRVRTMVIDGIVASSVDGVGSATEQALGFEDTLQRWAADCPRRRSCGFEDPIAAVDRFLERAEEGIPAGGQTFGPGEAGIALAYPLYSSSFWPALDGALSDALAGDARAMGQLAAAYAGVLDEFAIYFAVNCLDSEWPRDVETFLARAEDAGDRAPRFGEFTVNDYIRCARWPAEPDPVGPIAAAGAPPILVVSGIGDPTTPYENGVEVAERLESGVLVTYDGEGHTITFQGSGCIDALVTDYLLDRTVPETGTVC